MSSGAARAGDQRAAPESESRGRGSCIRGPRLLEASPGTQVARNEPVPAALDDMPDTHIRRVDPDCRVPRTGHRAPGYRACGCRHNSIGGSLHTKSKLGAVVVSLAAAATLAISGPAQADHQGQDRTYPSCKSLNRDFKHGVGRRGAVDRSSSTRVTNFTRNTRVYLLNNGPRTPRAATGQGQYDLDRDNAGIACEKL